MFRDGGSFYWDHGRLNRDGPQAKASRGPAQVGFGGRRPSDCGDPRGDYSRRVGGQASSRSRALGLKHASVRLTDVTVSGDG